MPWQQSGMLTLATASVVVAGALAGGFVSGLAGFGTGLVALGFWLHVLEPGAASTLVAVCSVVGQVQTIPTVWHAMDRRRVGPMIGAGLCGVPVGTALLSWLDIGSLRLAVGLLLIVFSGVLLLGGTRPRIAWGGRAADAAVGFGGGVLGGLAGLSGVLPTLWATLRGWGKDERRGVFQAFNLAVLGAVVVWHIVSGLMTRELAVLVLIALPGTLVGVAAGIRVYRRLSDGRFHRVVLGLLALSGLTLVWSGR